MEPNNATKLFSPPLYAETEVKQEWIDKTFYVLKVIKKKEDYQIDTYCLKNDIADPSNYHQSDILAGIEWERAEETSWKTYQFPSKYKTASFLRKKDKYADLSYPSYFIRLNNEETNAYVMPIETRILRKEFIEIIPRAKYSKVPPAKDEQRYALPKDFVIFGFDYIEPFILCNYLEKNIKFSKRKNEFNRFVDIRKKRGHPVPLDFIELYKKRRDIVNKILLDLEKAI